MPRKQRRLALVTTSIRPEALSVTKTQQATKSNQHSWQPARACDQIPVDPHETWLRYQAASVLGRPASYEEAKELFSKIDVHTRQPIQPERPLTWWRKLLSM